MQLKKTERRSLSYSKRCELGRYKCPEFLGSKRDYLPPRHLYMYMLCRVLYNYHTSYRF